MNRARRLPVLAAFLGVLGPIAWSAACGPTYVAAADDDAGADATTGPSSSSGAPDATSDSGFPPIPEFHPSFTAPDSGVSGITVAVVDNCPGITSPGGSLTGAYQAATGCFDKTLFGAAFDKYCPGSRVLEGAGKVEAALSVDGTTVTRTGQFALAGEVEMPCKNDSLTCAGIQTLITQFGASNASLAFSVACYDESATACVCQMELAGPYDIDPLTQDLAAGTLTEGSKTYAYGIVPVSNFVRLVRTDKKDAVPVENALVLDYVH